LICCGAELALCARASALPNSPCACLTRASAAATVCCASTIAACALAGAVGVFAQEPCPDTMKRAGPGERVCHGAQMRARNNPADPLDATRHLRRRPAREGHQQDTAWVCAVDDEVRNAMCERVGLARSRACDHKKRRSWSALTALNAMLHSSPLFAIELVEMGCAHERQRVRRRRPTTRSIRRSRSVRALTAGTSRRNAQRSGRRNCARDGDCT